jgi:hypothetical protein
VSRWLLALVPVLGLASLAGAEEEEMDTSRTAFVVMEHQGGSLAVSLASIVSVFRAQPSGDSPPPVRLTLSSGNRFALEGEAASALWSSLAEGAHRDAFLWVSHMGGTLGIPLSAIESVFRAGSEGAAVLRINYAGDPEGKALQGDEAQAVWERLSS